MKIKLAILENDISYLNRIISAFSTKYADKFELYSFTNCDMAISAMRTSRINVLIASDSFDIDVTALPKGCGFAYFVETADIHTYKEQKAICKYQKADLIYKQILSIYSEVAGSVSGMKLADDSCKVIAFTSPSGGVGSSSMAAACALYFTSQSKKTLYLNFEKFGMSDSFFRAEGQFDMSDIIFALKSKKANLPMKLESCVKQDSSGVCFYSKTKVALDMQELTTDDIVRLISEAKLSGEYEYIILDVDFSISKECRKVLRQAHNIVWTGDGSEISNDKIVRAYKALEIIEQNEDMSLINRISLVYNKFSNKSSKPIQLDTLKNIGGAPRYEHATTEQIINQLCSLGFFSKIS